MQTGSPVEHNHSAWLSTITQPQDASQGPLGDRKDRERAYVYIQRLYIQERWRWKSVSVPVQDETTKSSTEALITAVQEKALSTRSTEALVTPPGKDASETINT